MVSLLDVYLLLAVAVIATVNFRRGEFIRRFWGTGIVGILGIVHLMVAYRSFPLDMGLIDPVAVNWRDVGMVEVVFRLLVILVAGAMLIGYAKQKRLLIPIALGIPVLMALGFETGPMLKVYYTHGVVPVEIDAAARNMLEAKFDSGNVRAKADKRENRYRPVRSGYLAIARFVGETDEFRLRAVKTGKEEVVGTYEDPTGHSTDDYTSAGVFDFFLPPYLMSGDVPTSLNYIGICGYAPIPMQEEVLTFVVEKPGDVFVGYNIKAYNVPMTRMFFNLCWVHIPAGPAWASGERIFQITLVPPGEWEDYVL